MAFFSITEVNSLSWGKLLINFLIEIHRIKFTVIDEKLFLFLNNTRIDMLITTILEMEKQGKKTNDIIHNVLNWINTILELVNICNKFQVLYWLFNEVYGFRITCLQVEQEGHCLHLPTIRCSNTENCLGLAAPDEGRKANHINL